MLLEHFVVTELLYQFHPVQILLVLLGSESSSLRGRLDRDLLLILNGSDDVLLLANPLIKGVKSLFDDPTLSLLVLPHLLQGL